MGNVRPKFSEHTVYYIFFLKNIIIFFFSSLLFFLACLTGRRPFPCDGEATTPVTRVAAMRDLDGLERAPQMPRSTTSVCALAGDRLRVPRPGGVERWDADERRPPRWDGRGSSLCTWSLSSFVNGGRWVVCSSACVLAEFVGQMLLVQRV